MEALDTSSEGDRVVKSQLMHRCELRRWHGHLYQLVINLVETEGSQIQTSWGDMLLEMLERYLASTMSSNCKTD